MTTRQDAPITEHHLRASRDALTSGCSDEETATAVAGIFAAAASGREDAPTSLENLQTVLERIRHTPEGADRVSKMNAYVRTLGCADNLAAFLELIRAARWADESQGRAIAERCQNGRTHCIYGWAAQSMMIATQDEAVDATEPPDAGVSEFMAYSLPTWRLSVHIWQPNPEAEGFESTKRFEPAAIVEPPHSHPFSFVSYVSIGQMHQSIYVEDVAGDSSEEADRYHELDLKRVDGVWPPHPEYRPQRLKTLEDRVLLGTGDSYFMDMHRIHDVEVARADIDRPAITTFLCSETARIPQAYLVPAMADYHSDNPDILKRAKSLDAKQWDAKLAATARYLRGETERLQLGEIFQCGSSYGFMHV